MTRVRRLKKGERRMVKRDQLEAEKALRRLARDEQRRKKAARR